MTTNGEAREAIMKILEDKDSYSTSLNYAVNYCKSAIDWLMVDHTLAVQCLYILNNITHWRHPEAKNVRKVLKAFVKENGL